MKKFGLLGKRLDYSFSRNFFTEFFRKNDIQANYENFETADLDGWIKTKGYEGLSGFNVTIPYKEGILSYLDHIDKEATAIGAVNTVKIENGILTGYNTDAFGFRQSIKPFLNNKHERALILGTGGAAKAVEYVLKEIGIDVFYLSTSRTGEKIYTYEAANRYMMDACKMIINCTPVGTFPAVEDIPAIPVEFISEEHFVVDLIYNPEKTRLLQEAEKRGAIILNGESMLKEQALKAWDIWNQ